VKFVYPNASLVLASKFPPPSHQPNLSTFPITSLHPSFPFRIPTWRSASWSSTSSIMARGPQTENKSETKRNGVSQAKGRTRRNEQSERIEREETKRKCSPPTARLIPTDSFAIPESMSERSGRPTSNPLADDFEFDDADAVGFSRSNPRTLRWSSSSNSSSRELTSDDLEGAAETKNLRLTAKKGGRVAEARAASSWGRNQVRWAAREGKYKC